MKLMGPSESLPLQGSGDQGDTFISYAKYFKMGHIKWILPSAKTRRCTGAGGDVFPLWFVHLTLRFVNSEAQSYQV